MRVLVVHPHLDRFGGSERLTRILIYELSSLGIEVHVLTHRRNEEWFPDVGVDFRYIKPCSGCPRTGVAHVDKMADVLFSMTEVLSTAQPDVVFVMIQEPLYAVLSKTVNPAIGTGIYIHYPIEEEVTEANLFKFIGIYRFPNMYNYFYRSIDVHMVNSNFTAGALYRMYGLEANVVYPAIEWPFFRHEPSLQEARENVVISIGRFTPTKRQDALIRMFLREVKPEVPDAKLVIIGVPDDRHPEYYEHLKAISSESEDVVLIDDVITVEEMISYFQRAKAYVHMRVGEHFGMAPVEAMSQGVIPILPAESGLAELISHGRDGYLASTDQECVAYMLKILKMDNAEASEMRKLAYRKSWYFNPDRLAKEILAYLSLVVKRRA